MSWKDNCHNAAMGKGKVHKKCQDKPSKREREKRLSNEKVTLWYMNTFSFSFFIPFEDKCPHEFTWNIRGKCMSPLFNIHSVKKELLPLR